MEFNAFPSVSEIFRYRKQRGVNLGSWFVLEPWITQVPFRFAAAPAQSDLDVAKGSYAKLVLEKHWDSWIVESDWAWLKDHGFNTVRLPIGYYHLRGIDPSVLNGTDFSTHLAVYEGAWERIVNAIQTARNFGIGVLIDLHAAPGKQNPDSHAGTSSPNVQFFSNRYNLSHTTHVLSVLVKHIAAFENIVGVELINEPRPNVQQGEGEILKKWYLDTYHSLQQIDPTMPVYIGDCWDTEGYAEFISKSPGDRTTGWFVLDHHLYRCFTQEDTRMSIQEHINSVTNPNSYTPQLFSRVSAKLCSSGAAMIVGEWSGAVNPGSLQGTPPHEENRKRSEWLKGQLSLYEKNCAGWFFWCYKKEQKGDLGWSLRDSFEANVFPPLPTLINGANMPSDDDRAQKREVAKSKAYGEHVAYWSKYPGDYEHWRFADGFLQGWNDAWLFFDTSMNACQQGQKTAIQELGFQGPWLRRRLRQHVSVKGSGNGRCYWEFEHGFQQGMGASKTEIASPVGYPQNLLAAANVSCVFFPCFSGGSPCLNSTE
ncbi:glycosyl hydrolase 5 (cellulase A) family protein [Abortiporus biennis]